MMKKIILLLLFVLFTFSVITYVNAAACSVQSGIDGCLQSTSLVNPGSEVSIEGGFKDKLLDWITKIAGFLGLMAVGAIVFGSFMMVISTGEEEKIKKAKDMIKWAILGFLGIVLAATLISIVVKFMYSL